jgi:hypothetical protein
MTRPVTRVVGRDPQSTRLHPRPLQPSAAPRSGATLPVSPEAPTAQAMNASAHAVRRSGTDSARDSTTRAYACGRHCPRAAVNERSPILELEACDRLRHTFAWPLSWARHPAFVASCG